MLSLTADMFEEIKLTAIRERPLSFGCSMEHSDDCFLQHREDSNFRVLMAV